MKVEGEPHEKDCNGYGLADDRNPNRNYYLGDPERVKKAMEAVASLAKGKK